ncbi:hypothetical protein AAMO2058_001529300 [Amorphochlora amoebiformis]
MKPKKKKKPTGRKRYSRIHIYMSQKTLTHSYNRRKRYSFHLLPYSLIQMRQNRCYFQLEPERGLNTSEYINIIRVSSRLSHSRDPTLMFRVRSVVYVLESSLYEIA